jgi:hypothetical protein
MLSKTLHIRNTCFRMLPNPTAYHWDKKFFSLRKLLQEYKKKVQDDDITLQTEQVRCLTRLAEKVESELQPGPRDFGIPLLDALHSAIDDCDLFLKKHISRELITMVLREHFQEVLRMVNENNPTDGNAALNSDGGQAPTPTTAHGEQPGPSSSPVSPVPGGPGSRPPPRFADLNAASPEEKQETFMDIYFAVVLPRVMRQAVEAFRRRKTTRYAPSHHGRDASTGSAYSATGTTPVQSPRPGPTPTTLHETQSHGSGQMLQVGLRVHIDDSSTGIEFGHVRRSNSAPAGAGNDSPGHRALRRADTETLDLQANNIWCTLVFRMLCWLLLHDFHKKDVQISKSELLGSRLPVYIA